ncbi:MAG: tripartite tricarboxylate transporter TctB family protein [Burkholderiaceae bacterium]|jgi:hypothetical protein|nr:tripartite tricarboxylate transporter TctB family protein [Burkholderiaceae bacterium]
MNNQNLLRGVFLLAIALLFGIGAMRYQIGTLAHAGPGLFPLGVSCIVGLIGLLMIVRSRLLPKVPMDARVKNAVLILVSLVGFALITELLDMTAGILFMVFLSTLASKPYTWKRNLVIAVVLLGIAYAFQKLLGLNLPLF